MGIQITYVAEAVPFDPTGTILTSENTRAAILESLGISTGLPRLPYVLVHNGTLSNGQNIGWSNLTNTSPIVVAKKSELVEVTFSNQRTDADADFRFYKNTVSPGTLLFTWDDIRNEQTKILDGLSEAFDAGDFIIIEFDDQGTNPIDMVMVLFFQTVP